MFSIDPMSRIPIYEQIIRQTEQRILSGLLPPGSQLPSVRSLSIELSVNPNTIQKAYGELDTRGIIYSIPGIGCFVAEGAAALLSVFKRRRLSDFSALVEELALAGVEMSELQDILEKVYKERGVSHD